MREREHLRVLKVVPLTTDRVGCDQPIAFKIEPHADIRRDRPEAQAVGQKTRLMRYLKTVNYLATIMDLCTLRIVGCSVSDRNDSKLICTALENAALTRGEVREGIVLHSDRGSTYASDRYQRLLRRLKMHPSMSRAPAMKTRRWNRSMAVIKPPQCAITSLPMRPSCGPTSSNISKSSTTDTANTPRWDT